MTKNELKERVYAAIDRRAEEIVGLGERIRKHPELGFKEVKTARLVEETFAGLGLKPKAGLALTGVRAEAPGRGGDGPTFALLGELDGEGEAGLRLEPEPGEGLLDQPRGLDLLEAQLGMLPDPLAEPDDLLGAAVDGGVHALLQLVLRHGGSFPALFYPPWTTTTSSRRQAPSRWAWSSTHIHGAGSTRRSRRAGRAGDPWSPAWCSACSPSS